MIDYISLQDKMRIIQEIVPGKQITLAHIIANPDEILYKNEHPILYFFNKIIEYFNK
jgi:ethanolamine utilization microcompartment shell protein EutS